MGFYVSDEFRTNELSLTPGGSIVVVNYKNGESMAYDKIKKPAGYVYRIVQTAGEKIESIYVDQELVYKT